MWATPTGYYSNPSVNVRKILTDRESVEGDERLSREGERKKGIGPRRVARAEGEGKGKEERERAWKRRKGPGRAALG